MQVLANEKSGQSKPGAKMSKCFFKPKHNSFSGGLF